MELKKLNGLIKSIGTRSATLRDDIQAALIGCAYHAQLHRNTDPFNRLFDAVGTGTRKEGMLKWASLYAPVHFKDEKVVLSDKRQKEFVGTEADLMAELNGAEKWYALATPEKVQNPWDGADFLAKLADYLQQAAKKADKNGDSVAAQIAKDAEMAVRISITKTTAVEV